MKRLLLISAMLCLGVAAAYPSDFDFGESVASITDIRTRTSRISQSFQTLIDTLSYDANDDILTLVRHTAGIEGLDGVVVEDLFTEPRCKRFKVIHDSIVMESHELPTKTRTFLRRKMDKMLNNDILRWSYGMTLEFRGICYPPTDNWLYLCHKKRHEEMRREYLRFNVLIDSTLSTEVTALDSVLFLLFFMAEP